MDIKVCIVDVGWRGTIHDNIALLYPNIHFTGVYLGLQKFLNDQPSNTSKFAFGPNLNHQLEYPHFLDSVAPIEMITNSPSGSVTGYEEKMENSLLSVKLMTMKTPRGVSLLKPFRKGFWRVWNPFLQQC
jgi:hypothetical protein